MNQRPNKADKLYCGKCRTRLLGEMVPAGALIAYTGVAGMYCYKCDTTTPIWPRRIQQVAAQALSHVAVGTVADNCVICRRPIATLLRRGRGERILFCETHPETERAEWRSTQQGKCLTPGCEKLPVSRGRCNPCYSRWWRTQATRTRQELRRITAQITAEDAGPDSA